MPTIELSVALIPFLISYHIIMDAFYQEIDNANFTFLSVLPQKVLNELFIWACGFRSPSVIKEFVSVGADLALDENRPLFAACEYGNLEAVNYLLGFARVRNNAHKMGNRAFIAAQLHNHSAIIERLSQLTAVADGYKLLERAEPLPN